MRISDWSSDVCSSDLKASKCPRNLLQCFNSARAIPFPVIGHAKVCVVPVRRMRIAAYRACDPLDRLVFGARVRRNQRTIGERFAVIWSVSDGRLGLFESPFVISFVIELNESLQPVTIPLADARHVFVRDRKSK